MVRRPCGNEILYSPRRDAGGASFYLVLVFSPSTFAQRVLCIGETPPRKIEHGQETMQEQGFVWRVARWINETSHRVLLRDGWCDVRNEIHQSLVLFK